MKLRLTLVALTLAACHPPPGEAEPVRIVAVTCEPRAGDTDCDTVVEFADGTRRTRRGTWGVVGDTFRASKTSRGHWR